MDINAYAFFSKVKEVSPIVYNQVPQIYQNTFSYL